MTPSPSAAENNKQQLQLQHPVESITQPRASNVEPSSGERRNDDSNPQQGTPVTDAAEVSHEQASRDTVYAQNGSTVNRPRPSVPPFKKDSRKLFVGGLPADVTDAEFKDFFEQYGELVDSVVMFDYETHRSRGFGFVTFKDPKVASYLLTLGHEENDGSTSGRVQMRDKLIEIKMAEPKEGRGSRARYAPRRTTGANGTIQATVDAKLIGPTSPQPAYVYGTGAAGPMPVYPFAASYYPQGAMVPGYMAPFPQAYFAPQSPDHLTPSVPPPMPSAPVGQPPIYNMNDQVPVDPAFAHGAASFVGPMHPYTFYPVAHGPPPAYFGFSGVMQPVAPGIPGKADDVVHPHAYVASGYVPLAERGAA